MREKEYEQRLKHFESLVAETFKEADEDQSGYLDIEEVKPICETLVRSFKIVMTPAQEQRYYERMWNWLDSDGSGRVTFYEFKVVLMRAFVNRSLPEELMEEGEAE